VCVLQREHEVANANHPTRPPLARGESVELSTEKMDPQVPVRQDS
jgi:hypothetical protein